MQQRKVDHFVLHLNAQLFQVFGKRGDHTPHGTRTVQKFDGQRLASAVAQSAIAVSPTGISQQITRLAQVVAQGVPRIDGQIRLGRLRNVLFENSGRQLGRQRLQQSQFIVAGSAFGLEVAGHKVPTHAAVGVVKQLAIQPLKVHGQRDRLAHTHILELVAAQVELKALKVARIAVRQLGLDQLATLECAAREGPGPLARNERLHVIELPRLEGFELRGAVFVNFVGDAVKVEQSLAHIQVFGPISRIAHIGDVFAKLHRADSVRA